MLNTYVCEADPSFSRHNLDPGLAQYIPNSTQPANSLFVCGLWVQTARCGVAGKAAAVAGSSNRGTGVTGRYVPSAADA